MVNLNLIYLLYTIQMEIVGRRRTQKWFTSIVWHIFFRSTEITIVLRRKATTRRLKPRRPQWGHRAAVIQSQIQVSDLDYLQFFQQENNWLFLPPVIIEKSCGGRFLWKRNWDFGWIWAGWHYWFGPIMSNFLGWFFFKFSLAKKKEKKNIVGSTLKSYIKWIKKNK